MGASTEECASDDGGGHPASTIQTGDGVDGASLGDDGGCATLTLASDKQFCIDNDSHSDDAMEERPCDSEGGEKLSAVDVLPETGAGKATSHDNIATSASKPGPSSNQSQSVTGNASNDSMENQPLDQGDSRRLGAARISAETGDEVTVCRDNIATAVKSRPTSRPTRRSVTDKKAGDAIANDDASRALSPPRLNEAKTSNARPRNSPSSPTETQKSMPQSRRSPVHKEGENDESVFGPFVAPVVESEWNPFGEKSDGASGEMFHVDDDDVREQSNNSQGNGPYQKKTSLGSAQTSEAELDGLRRVFDSEYERAIEDQEISWRARYGATRCSFVMSALLMVVYLWLGCMFYRSEAGWSIPDALLFTVYTVTTVGYGGPQPLPNTAAFHAFTSVYVVAGISLVTVLGAHTYQLLSLEATRMRANPWGRQRGQSQSDAANDFGQEALTREMDKYRQQFMSELEDLARDQPFVDAVLVKIKEFQLWRRTTKSGRVLSVGLPFLGNIFLGAMVVGSIEGWSPLESIYWSIVTLTTVGYGDYVPTKNSSVWFCTLFFIPSSLFFLSFLLAHVAKTYIRHHAIQVTRLERNMRRKNERRRMEAEREEKAKRSLEATNSGGENPSSGDRPTLPASPGDSPGAEDVEGGFTTVISYTEDEHLDNSPTKSSGLFGDQAGILDEHEHNNNDPLSPESSPALRYRANVIRNKDTAPDPGGNRAVSFAEALCSLNQPASRSLTPGGGGEVDEFANENQVVVNKPSLEVRLRVQARLARIIAEEVAGYQTGVIIKGSTVSLTVGSLRDTADKWRIPPQAWKAFRAVSFRSLLFVGERDLISDGGDALLRLNVVEFHQIFSPMLAAMGDGSSMEAWLAATDVLADVELRGGARYGRGKPIFNGTFT